MQTPLAGANFEEIRQAAVAASALAAAREIIRRGAAQGFIDAEAAQVHPEGGESNRERAREILDRLHDGRAGVLRPEDLGLPLNGRWFISKQNIIGSHHWTPPREGIYNSIDICASCTAQFGTLWQIQPAQAFHTGGSIRHIQTY